MRQNAGLCGNGLTYLPTDVPSICVTFNSLPNDKILDLSELKAFADERINVVKKIKICLRKGRKTWWKKEKMLVTSIFSFSHNVFKRGCVVKGLSPFFNPRIFSENIKNMKLTISPHIRFSYLFTSCTCSVGSSCTIIF